MQCPKCNYEQPDSATQCLKCGVIFAKLHRGSRPQPAVAAAVAGPAAGGESGSASWESQNAEYLEKMREQALDRARAFTIKQQREGLEAITGFEFRNRYTIGTGLEPNLYDAEELGGGFAGFLLRGFLRKMRPFKLEIRDSEENLVVRIERPFRFYFHELTVHDAGGVPIAKVKRRFTLLRRKYDIEDPTGRLRYELFGPILRPWTFQILKDGQEIGLIQKKWSGFIKEGFTEADNFRLELNTDLDRAQKKLLLGAVFLIDFVHFEK